MTPTVTEEQRMQIDLDALQKLEQSVNDMTWDEEWRPIPGYPGYEISDHGNVRSHFAPGNNKKRMLSSPRLLRRSAARGKYLRISLPNPTGSYRNIAVHRLVMLAFVGPCPDGLEVAHLNGVSTDNRLLNLAYVTHQENERHKIQHGTNGAGERNSNAHFLGWQIEEIRYLASKGIPHVRIANLFEVNRHYVDDIVRGDTWPEIEPRTALPALIAKCREQSATIARFREQCVDQMTRAGEIINERDDLRSQLAAANERIAELENELSDVRVVKNSGALDDFKGEPWWERIGQAISGRKEQS